MRCCINSGKNHFENDSCLHLKYGKLSLYSDFKIFPFCQNVLVVVVLEKELLRSRPKQAKEALTGLELSIPMAMVQLHKVI